MTFDCCHQLGWTRLIRFSSRTIEIYQSFFIKVSISFSELFHRWLSLSLLVLIDRIPIDRKDSHIRFTCGVVIDSEVADDWVQWWSKSPLMVADDNWWLFPVSTLIINNFDMISIQSITTTYIIIIALIFCVEISQIVNRYPRLEAFQW